MRITVVSICTALMIVTYVRPQSQPIEALASSFPDGHSEISITNYSHQPVTAFVILAEHVPLVNTVRHSSTVRYVDSIMNSVHDRPLMWKDTETFTFGGPNPGPDKMRVDVTLKAALFEDGSIFGDPAWADRLVQGRKLLYRHLGEALQYLESARERGESRDELIRESEETEKAKLSATQDREEERGVRTVYEEIRANLEHSERADGSVVPVDERVQDIVSHLLQRRQRLLSSKPSVTKDAGSLNPINP